MFFRYRPPGQLRMKFKLSHCFLGLSDYGYKFEGRLSGLEGTLKNGIESDLVLLISGDIAQQHVGTSENRGESFLDRNAALPMKLRLH